MDKKLSDGVHWIPGRVGGLLCVDVRDGEVVSASEVMPQETGERLHVLLEQSSGDIVRMAHVVEPPQTRQRAPRRPLPRRVVRARSSRPRRTRNTGAVCASCGDPDDPDPEPPSGGLVDALVAARRQSIEGLPPQSRLNRALRPSLLLGVDELRVTVDILARRLAWLEQGGAR